MIKLKDLLTEELITEADIKVYRDSKGIYLDTGKYDKRFNDLKQLASWLNKNKYRYIGIDDR